VTSRLYKSWSPAAYFENPLDLAFSELGVADEYLLFLARFASSRHARVAWERVKSFHDRLTSGQWILCAVMVRTCLAADEGSVAASLVAQVQYSFSSNSN
jgi:hypothetical protein